MCRYRNRRFLVTWGNGAVQTNLNEQWDDGNEVNSDGCSSTCQIETGYTWSGDPSVWQKCGNSKKEGTEGCDDGNFITGDGWSSSWTVEGGWTWNGAVLSICQYWGNGIKEGTEACDDGNTDLIYYLIWINSNKL